MKCHECPPHCLKSDSTLNVQILGYIIGVIIIDEVTSSDLPERCKRRKRQKKVNQQSLSLFYTKPEIEIHSITPLLPAAISSLPKTGTVQLAPFAMHPNGMLGSDFYSGKVPPRL
jgi:hypothetical protein